LKEQIKERRKQYEYYRDQLFDLEGKNGVEMKSLGEVCSFRNGYAFKSGKFKETGLPIIRITNISNNNIDLEDCKYFDTSDYRGGNFTDFAIIKGDILIAMSGATTGKVGVYKYSYTSYLNQRVGKFMPDLEKLDKRFLYHYLLGKNQEIYILAGGGAQPNLSSTKLMSELYIPIPSKEEQLRIVTILDQFEASIANLEAQLKEREKQYEYYRNQLLTFE
jgi:type I restriction enzyme S subunit